MIKQGYSVDENQNLLSKFYNGKCSLGKSFWIGYILVPIGIKFVFLATLIAISQFNPNNEHIVLLAVAVIAAVIAAIAYNIAAVIGAWRSATNHIEATGKKFMARAAQTYIALSVLVTLIVMIMNILVV